MSKCEVVCSITLVGKSLSEKGFDFDETFRQLRKEAEARAEELRKVKPVGKSVNDGRKLVMKKMDMREELIK